MSTALKYAGIGSRQTPVKVLAQMRAIGQLLAMGGLTLRSGKALGADSAFEVGARIWRAPMELFDRYDTARHPEWAHHASVFHPAWHKLKPEARQLHARNSAIMLGAQLDDPVKFVCCWTRDGEAVGGTGQALRIAAAYRIPVFNLALWGANAQMWEWLS